MSSPSLPGGCCGGDHEHDHGEVSNLEPEVLTELARIEDEFEAAEMEALKSQYKLLAPIFTKRAAVIAKVPEFWPRVFSASKSLDELITPNDAKLFEEHLIGLDVIRPEADKEGGDIRTFEITFTFSENPYLADTTLTKRFYNSAIGRKNFGPASEPVKINWKEGQDLTKGINQKAYDFFHAKKEELKNAAGKEDKETTKLALPDWEELISEEDKSFFNWFSWWGGALNAARAEAKGVDEKEEAKDDEELDEEDEEDDEDHEGEHESVFPGGGELADYIIDDLFPNAIKYLTDSLEGHDGSEFDDEDLEMLGSDEEEELMESIKKQSSNKKRKADEDKADKKKKSKA